MATLPDPASLPLFQHVARDGSSRALTGHAPDPRVVTEYVFSSESWRRGSGGGGGGGRGSVPTSVDDILSRATGAGGGDEWLCAMCGLPGGGCAGGACVEQFRGSILADGAASVEVRHAAGARAVMGVGVFATWRILAGTSIGEYLGELLPANTNAAKLVGDIHAFRVTGVGYITSKLYGNWTRFVNHRCVDANVTARRVMYGKRIVMMFIAVTDIRPGEQLFIDYGRPFFENQGIMCECDDIAGPHLPPRAGEAPGPGPTGDGVGDDAEPLTIDVDVNCGDLRVARREVRIDRGRGGRGPVTIDIDVYLKSSKGAGGDGGDVGGVPSLARPTS